MTTKGDKRNGGERKQRVTPEHRGVVSKPGNGGAREGAGRKKRCSTYKTRNWATILYPESAKEGWRDILRGWCCQALLSPLHDKDENPDGTPKKPHYHLMCMWDGPKGQALMEERFAELGGVGCQPCNSSRGYARYLCHLDNPEKYQYPVEAVEAFGGANYLDVIALESDRRATIAEMCRWCRDEGCISFAALCEYAMDNKPTWWQAITSNSTMLMFRFIRSLEDEMKKGKFQKPVPVPEKKSEEPRASRLSPLEEARHRAREARQRLEEALYAVSALENGPTANTTEEIYAVERRLTETGAGPLCAGKDT